MRRFLAPAAALLCVLSLAGCTFAGTTSGSGSSPGTGVQQGVPAAPSKGEPSKSDAAIGTAEAGRQVITTATLNLTVDAPRRAADDAAQIVEAAGGRVDGRVEKAPVDGQPASAQLTLRVPSKLLTPTLAAIERLGSLEDLSLARQDVTTQSQDLDARITALQASVDRLLDLMSRATTTADLIAIESALSERQANLESLQAEKRGLADQVDLSTISLTLGSKATAPTRVPDSFLGGLLAGWNALVGFFAAALVVLGVALPWLILLAIVAAIWLLIVRRSRVRAAKAKTPPAS
jgi:hypothetical protein